jgi:hypothetical protein
MNHIFVDITFFLIITVLLLIVYIRQMRCKEISNNLIKILSKNVDFLTEYYKKQEIILLKNTIQLYSQFQIILKISKCDYVSFFKYDFSKRYIMIHFLLSVDDKGTIVQESVLDNLPATSNLLTLNIMKTDDKDLYSIKTSALKEKNEKTYEMIESRGIKKIYYQNVFKDKENPLGFVSISYKNEDYIISEDDKKEILRIIEKMKTYL